MLRSFFIGLSQNDAARNFVTHFGPARRMARRFVAGETIDDAVATVRDLNALGIKAVLNHVGESVTNRAEASEAAAEFQQLLHRIHAEGLDSTISMKLSHVGLGFGKDFCYENVADVVQTGRDLNITVELDIEGSADVDATLEIYHRLLDTFGGGVRQALQTYLHRTPADARAIAERGAGVRLVKGAYQEPPEIAYQDGDRINQATIEVMKILLEPDLLQKGAYLALGSHDPVLIEWLLQEAEARDIGKDKFEIQMLLGVRRDEQKRLAEAGYTVRIYVPYGSAWYPYFMRRLAERPANVLFMARALLGG